MDTKRTDIILEVIYKMSLSPNFKKSNIRVYIGNLEQIYNPKGIRTNGDLIEWAKHLSELNNMFPQYKCIFPYYFENGVEFIQTPITSDGNCLFSCLAYLNKWKGKDHKFVRKTICDNLNTVINILRNTIYELNGEGHSCFNILLQMDYPFRLGEFEKDTTNEKYITEMAGLNIWGTAIEILTAIFITKQDIHLYTIKFPDSRRIGILQEIFAYIKNYLILFKQITIDDSQIPLNLYFCDGKHYELLQPVNGPPLKAPDVLRSDKDRKDIFDTAQKILGNHTNPNVIAQIQEEEALAESEAASSTQPAASATPTKPPVKPTKDYICISNPEGEFSDSECTEVSRKVSSSFKPLTHIAPVLDEEEQMKNLVIDQIINEIIQTPDYDMNLYKSHLSRLEELYSYYFTQGFLKDKSSDEFRTIVRDLPEFKSFFPYICNFTNPELQSKFTRIPTLDNGNCLFESLQLGITEWKELTPSEVRQIICENLFYVINQLKYFIKIQKVLGSENSFSLEFIIEDVLKKPSLRGKPITDDIINQYIARMIYNETEGGLLEIITAIYITHHNIVIYKMDGKKRADFESYKNELIYHSKEQMSSSFYSQYNFNIDFKIENTKPIVNLYHCNRNGDMLVDAGHFELLVEKQVPYAYKYMKYKMKYLTLKNNTHYNKYL